MPASLSAESASRSDERLARQVLLVAGLFADQHEIGLFWTFARHRLRSIAIERTSATASARSDLMDLPLPSSICRSMEAECPAAANVQKRGYKGIFMSLLP
jgi:hypothetical protein